MTNDLIYLPVAQLKIHPQNIRLYYPPVDIEKMAASLQSPAGQIQALQVVPADDGFYYVVDGNMRLTAARTIPGFPPLKCEVISASQAEQLLMMLTTTEFVFPKDQISRARHYRRLQEQEGLTVGQIAAAIGLSESSIYNALSLLELDEPIQQLIIERRLTMDIGVARLLLRVPNTEQRIKLAQRYAKQKMSARAISQSLQYVLRQYQQVEGQPAPKPPKRRETVADIPVAANGKFSAEKVRELARLHLCDECRLDGLGPKCYTCPGPYEFINHLVDLLPAEEAAAHV